MGKTAQFFGQEAFDFIDDLNRLSTTQALAEAMIRVTTRFGFDGLFIGGRNAHPSLSFNELLFATKCPPEFQAVYHRQGYIHVDPTLKRCLRSPHPFEFSTCNYGELDGPRVPEIMRLLEDFRFFRGVVIPIHGPGGYEAAVGLVGEKLDLSARTKPAMHLMALYAYQRVRQLVEAEADDTSLLTSREREVLAWSAQGKSAWEIGEILNIAKRTVDEHAQSAMRKLGAVTRTQAVAIALRRRLFEI
jgi:LuxR family quorum sensing-dependent transcriptional regulator